MNTLDPINRTLIQDMSKLGVQMITPMPPPVNLQMQQKNNAFENEFLTELRDFMSEFAETDLNINSIEEASSMTKAQANYYVKLYQHILQEEAEMNKLCDEEIERTNKAINTFREKRQNEYKRKKSYFESILKDYAMNELQDKKTKTLKLPNGNISFKKQQPKFKYENETQIREFVKILQPELVKVDIVEKLDKTALKKRGEIKEDGFYLNGQKVESITIENQEDKFEIKGV